MVRQNLRKRPQTLLLMEVRQFPSFQSTASLKPSRPLQKQAVFRCLLVKLRNINVSKTSRTIRASLRAASQ